MLRALQPEHKWKDWKLFKPHHSKGVGTSKAQTQLYQMVKDIFPGERVELNYKQIDLYFENHKHNIEYDVSYST
jgi:hypothetical protein